MAKVKNRAMKYVDDEIIRYQGLCQLAQRTGNENTDLAKDYLRRLNIYLNIKWMLENPDKHEDWGVFR